MMTTKYRRRILAATCVIVLGGSAEGRLGAGGQQGRVPEVKAVPYSAIPSVDGKDNFAAYCAVCHGLDAKGQGPAAPAMKARVPDLTTLTRRDGKLDAAAVEYVIRGTGKTATPVHGTPDMPVWGAVFAPTPGDRAAADVRIRNIVQYLASIQRGR